MISGTANARAIFRVFGGIPKVYRTFFDCRLIEIESNTILEKVISCIIIIIAAWMYAIRKVCVTGAINHREGVAHATSILTHDNYGSMLDSSWF